jgi:hypothetical protein
MSKTLKIYSEILAICEKAGLDPNVIDSVMITPTSVQFAILVEPVEITKSGLPLVDVVTHPWTREP